jgi:DNA-directed RNA polymerase subunit alpha
MENILLPSRIQYNQGDRPNEGVLVVEPCFYGYGTTLGNALRRVLLSSLPGAAVTAVKIKGVNHEFQAVEGVKEDALEIILNIKSLRLKSFSDEPVKLTLNVSGSKVITAADIEANADVEIMNKDLVIATVTDDSINFEMELTIQKGRGYVPSEDRGDENLDLGTIAIDALFSPIRNVGYRVEATRVGEITNYDRLIMNIETDGTITPQEAVEQSSKILIDYFSILTNNEPTEKDSGLSDLAVE